MEICHFCEHFTMHSALHKHNLPRFLEVFMIQIRLRDIRMMFADPENIAKVL